MSFAGPAAPALESVSAPDASPVPKEGLYQCSQCQRTYGRLEHLSRHVRAHTKERPHVCELCSKGFSRSDLLKRHVVIHSESRSANRKGRRRDGLESRRARQACSTCINLHLKCNDEKPCRRCKEKNLICSRGTVQNGRTEPDADTNGSCPSSPRDHSITMGDFGQEAYGSSMEQNLSAPTSLVSGNIQRHLDSDGQDRTINREVGHSQPMLRSTMPTDINLDWFSPSTLERTMLNVRGNPSAYQSNQPLLGSGTMTPHMGISFGFATDLQLNEIEMDSLFNYNAHAPFDYGGTPEDHYPSNNSNDEQSTDARTEAFLRSGLRFRPCAGDHASAEDDNLLLSSDREDSEAQRGSNRPRPGQKRETLSQAGRDRVMRLILTTREPSSLLRSWGIFPSVELLDKLLRYYLASPGRQTSTWIHLPTLELYDATQPELLATMIAAGAIRAPDEALRKLGFAMQEILRIAIPSIWEKDNSRTRDLHLLQAYLILLETGMWSGNSRKMELSESFLTPLTTMIRRSGCFRAAKYSPMACLPEESPSELAEQWKLWIELESRKRLVFRLLALASDASISLSVPPVIALEEMTTPLPCLNALWTAPTSTAWREMISFQLAETQVFVSPIDCLNNLELLRRPRPDFDVEEARYAFLHCCWGIVWSLRQLSTTLKTDTLAMLSPYEDITKKLRHFSLTCLEAEGRGNLRQKVLIESILMHLNVNLDDIHACAGIEGKEEIFRVFPKVQEWAKSSRARSAIWHAGQVLGIARHSSKGSLIGAGAIAVYHASLTLWAYSVAQHASNNATYGDVPGAVAKQGLTVYLDQPETLSAQRFVSAGIGDPTVASAKTIQDQGETLMTNNPGIVMKVAAAILCENFSPQSDQAPALVRNLVQLMEALRDAGA